MRTTTTLVAALLLAGCGSATEAPTDAGPVEVAQAKVIPVTSDSTEAIDRFERGRAYFENFRPDDATAMFDEALALDPEFAQAHAYRGMLRQGPDGVAQMRKARDLAKDAPEPERLAVEAMLAQRDGDMASAKAKWAEVAALAPDDWRPPYELSWFAFGAQDWAGAKDLLTRAVEREPRAGEAWNLLGYTYAHLGDYDAAVVAFDKYAEAAPIEPNPHDSKAEVLMMAGRLEEAEQAFARATEVNPAFWQGFAGVAQTRFLRGDWEGGRTALGKAIGAATLPEDRVAARVHLAWSWIAVGDPEQAAIVLGEAETEAQAAALAASYAMVPLERVEMSLMAARWVDAAAHADEALARAEAGKLEGADLIGVRLQANAGKAVALAMKGDTAGAEGLLATVEDDITRLPGTEGIGRVTRAAIALGKNDAVTAIGEVSLCDPRDASCLWLLETAHRKAGDTAAAAATRERILGLNGRTGMYLGVWAQAGGVASLGATTAAE